MNNDENLDPNGKLDGYTLKMARNLIFKAYEAAGAKGDLGSCAASPMAKELGQIPDGKYEGLFRYLDECLNLTHVSEFALITAMGVTKDQSIASLVILMHQIRSNGAAVRVLSALGLESQARITLRALYENCLAFCRAVVDGEFRVEFRSASTMESANEFWHRFLSKSKTERFLSQYNSEHPKAPCPLVIGDLFSGIYNKLGVTAHPNYIFSQFGWQDAMLGDDDNVFPGSKAATEFTLTSANHLILAALIFLGIQAEGVCKDARCNLPGSRFSDFPTSAAALKALGTASMIMLAMLMKWINRQRSDFDPEKHY